MSFIIKMTCKNCPAEKVSEFGYCHMCHTTEEICLGCGCNGEAISKFGYCYECHLDINTCFECNASDSSPYCEKCVIDNGLCKMCYGDEENISKFGYCHDCHTTEEICLGCGCKDDGRCFCGLCIYCRYKKGLMLAETCISCRDNDDSWYLIGGPGQADHECARIFKRGKLDRINNENRDVEIKSCYNLGWKIFDKILDIKNILESERDNDKLLEIKSIVEDLLSD